MIPLRSHLALLTLPLVLGGCLFMSHVATLPVGEDGGRALRDAAHVLGRPDKKWAIKAKDGSDSGIDIVTFESPKAGNLALYFYNGAFIEIGTFNADTGFSSIRPDFADIAHRKQGPDVYVLERRGGKIHVKTLDKNRPS